MEELNQVMDGGNATAILGTGEGVRVDGVPGAVEVLPDG
jgi:hypothetical protein